MSKLFTIPAVVFVVAFPALALAQGGGGAGGGGAGSGGTGAAAGGAAGGGSGMSMNPAANNRSPRDNASGVGGEAQTPTTPEVNSVGESNVGRRNEVSAPGMGVGTSANGRPIGSPGSGPGSPEQPIDALSPRERRIRDRQQ